MTAIDPDDIRVGDTVQRTIVEKPWVVITAKTDSLHGDGNYYAKRSPDPEVTYAWELIDRPVPKPTDGSKWRPRNGWTSRFIYDALTDSYVVWRASGMFDIGVSWSISQLSEGFFVPDTDA